MGIPLATPCCARVGRPRWPGLEQSPEEGRRPLGLTAESPALGGTGCPASGASDQGAGVPSASEQLWLGDPALPPSISGDPVRSEKLQQKCLFSSDIFKKNSFPQMLDLASGMRGGKQLSTPQTLYSLDWGSELVGLPGGHGLYVFRAWNPALGSVPSLAVSPAGR